MRGQLQLNHHYLVLKRMGFIILSKKELIIILAPKVKNGQLLAVPITEGANPLCAYFIKEISRQSEIIDYGLIL